MSETATYRTLTIAADGTIGVVETDGRPQLATLQMLVGGYVEAIDLVRYEAADACVWINEDGKATEPVNPTATRLARHYGAIFSDDRVHGAVAITGPVDPEGETTDLDLATIAVIVNVVTGWEREPLRLAPTFMQSIAEAVYAGVPVIVVEPEPTRAERFELTIDLGNAAFHGEGGTPELALLLRTLADRVGRYGLGRGEGLGEDGPIIDSNGNTVGSWTLR